LEPTHEIKEIPIIAIVLKHTIRSLTEQSQQQFYDGIQGFYSRVNRNESFSSNELPAVSPVVSLRTALFAK
jgi:hypothetical protein